MGKIKILIVDDDELVTMSLEMILGADSELEVIGKGNSGADAIRLYDELKPDILLMDIRMKDMTGVDAAETILRTNRDACILFLTTFKDDEYIIRALQLGVRGYLLKQDYDSIPDSIRAVMRGQNVFGGEIIQKMPRIFLKQTGSTESEDDDPDKKINNGGDELKENTENKGDNLKNKPENGGEDINKKSGSGDRYIYEKLGITPKEYEVIQFVALGYSNKEISEKIFLSEGTIKNYISNILDKLDLRDRTQLAIYYLRNEVAE